MKQSAGMWMREGKSLRFEATMVLLKSKGRPKCTFCRKRAKHRITMRLLRASGLSYRVTRRLSCGDEKHFPVILDLFRVLFAETQP